MFATAASESVEQTKQPKQTNKTAVDYAFAFSWIFVD